jgi:RimJ/RimL family protein N-acetyltransferase
MKMDDRLEEREVVAIRTTCPADAEALCALRVEGLRAHPTAFVTTAAEALAEDWRKRAAEGNGEGLSAIFVAEAGGELVAMTGIVASPRERLRHSAFIWGVYVRPAWRGGRLAERLVNAAVAWARGKGCTIVRLGVTAGNEAASRTYVRCGFEVYGRERASQVVEGVEYEEVLMDRRIDCDGRTSH